MSKSALVPIADGTEELEAVTIIDVLRRAGAEVTVTEHGVAMLPSVLKSKKASGCPLLLNLYPFTSPGATVKGSH